MKSKSRFILVSFGLLLFAPSVSALAQGGECNMIRDPKSPACKEVIAKSKRAELNKCIDSVRDGPTRKDLRLFGHDFNCKRASILKRGHQVQITGELSHNVRGQPDDQIDYSIVKTFNPGDKSWRIDRPHINIRRGGWGQIGGVAISSVATYFGVPIPPQAPEMAIDKLTDAATGNWHEAAHKTVAAIAFLVH